MRSTVITNIVVVIVVVIIVIIRGQSRISSNAFSGIFRRHFGSVIGRLDEIGNSGTETAIIRIV